MHLSALRVFNVSYNVLSSIPWAGTSRLVSIMDQVVHRGPNDQKTWSSLVRRADMILDSFSSHNLARMVVLMTKTSFSDQDFLEKLKSQSLIKLEEADLLSCCGFLYGLDKLGLSDSQLISGFRTRVTDQLSSATGPYPLVLLLNVYSNTKDTSMTTTLLQELTKYMNTLKPQSFAMILVDVLSNFNNSDVYTLLDPFVINSLNCMEKMDFRSLVQLYATFSRTTYPLRTQYLSSLANYLSRSIQHASLHHLSVILRSYSKCLLDTELLRSVLSSLKSKYESGDVQELIFILSHLLKLKLADLDLANQLLNHILKFNNINSVQFSNLVYLCGKFKLNIPFEYISGHFERLKHNFSFKDLALFSFGLERLGNSEYNSELVEMAKQMLTDPQNYNTISHLMLKKIFNLD